MSVQPQWGIAAAVLTGYQRQLLGCRGGCQAGSFTNPALALGRDTRYTPRRPLSEDLQRPSLKKPSTCANLNPSVSGHTAPSAPKPSATVGLTFAPATGSAALRPTRPRAGAAAPRARPALPECRFGCGSPVPRPGAARGRASPGSRRTGGGWHQRLPWRRGARGSSGARVALAVAALGRGSRGAQVCAGAAAGASAARPAPPRPSPPGPARPPPAPAAALPLRSSGAPPPPGRAGGGRGLRGGQARAPGPAVGRRRPGGRPAPTPAPLASPALSQLGTLNPPL